MRFLVSLAEANLDGLRPGAWEDLRTDIITFAAVPPLRREECTRDLIRELQLNVFAVLLRLASRSGAPSSFPPIAWSWGTPIIPVWRYREGEIVPSLPAADEAAGSPRDLFLWAFFVTLSKVDLFRLRQCGEDCLIRDGIAVGRLFWAEHGNQWYCSPRCANRAKLRRFRAKPHPVIPEPQKPRRKRKEV